MCECKISVSSKGVVRKFRTTIWTAPHFLMGVCFKINQCFPCVAVSYNEGGTWGTEVDTCAQEGRGNRDVEKTTWRAALWSVLLAKYCSGDQIKKNEIGVGWACSTYGIQERCMLGFGGETWEERDYLEELGLNGRILIKWIFKMWDGEAWTGLIWLRIGTGGWRLWMRLWTFVFHEMGKCLE